MSNTITSIRKTEPRAPLLHVEGALGFSQTYILENIDLKIVKGKWHCLLGASGVGKSALLRFIADLPHEMNFRGNMSWNGIDNQAPKIAYMAQQDLLLPHKNIVQNITIGAVLRGDKIDQQHVDKLLTLTGLHSHSDKKPHQLSGGMRQRTALARTLYEQGELILMDEPFSKLDAQTRLEMMQLSQSLLKGKTILHITHDPREAALLSHHISILKKCSTQHIDMPTSEPMRQIDDGEVIKLEKDIYQEIMDDGGEILS